VAPTQVSHEKSLPLFKIRQPVEYTKKYLEQLIPMNSTFSQSFQKAKIILTMAIWSKIAHCTSQLASRLIFFRRIDRPYFSLL
jgi:hypothetical protein